MSDETSSGLPHFDALSSDYDKCLQHLDKDDTQFWRRTLIRTVFSMFEAMNDQLRRNALAATTSGDKKSFNLTRMELLGDVAYKILKNGKVEPEARRIPFLNHTAFILRTLAEESYVEAAFFGDNGWNEFQKAVQVRNRLTHPKEDTDLNVTQEELVTVQEAVRWYFLSAVKAVGNDKFWRRE